MTEPAIKKRVLTKVRRGFLYKHPPDDDETIENVNLIATPEQLDEETTLSLETSLGLVESNRKIYSGQEYLNLHFKIDNLKIEGKPQSQIVTLDISSNNVHILPWEYCVQRLESYGDLELATWASRLKIYHKNYAENMEKYLWFANSTDPQAVMALTQGKEQALQGIRDIESKYYDRKLVFYADRKGIVPVSLSFHEGLIKDLGHTVDGFVKWTKKHGIPGIFKNDSEAMLNLSKQRLLGGASQTEFFQEGDEYESPTDIYDKKGQKKAIPSKMYIAMTPTPQGFYLTIYAIRKDPQPIEVLPKNDDIAILHEKKVPKSEENNSESIEIEVQDPGLLINTNDDEDDHDKFKLKP